MPRFVGTLVALVLLLGAHAWSLAQADARTPFDSVEGFLAALSDGDVMGAMATLAADVVLEERDLYARVSTGPRAVQDRLWELVLDGVRIEAELLEVLGGGRLLVVAERRWGDSVPEAIAPLRSTSVYLVEGRLIASVTRLLAPEQRDARMLPALEGTWRGGDRGLVVRFDGEGGFLAGFSQAQVAEAPRDAGSYGLEGGVLTWLSDERSRMCTPGDDGTHHVRFIDADTLEWQIIEEGCLERYMGTRARLVRMTAE